MEANYSRLWIAVCALVGCLIIGSLGYFVLGQAQGHDWPLFDCMYMALITLSTVGFGDQLNIVTGNWPGLMFTAFVIMMGMGAVAYAMSTLTAIIIEGDLRKLMRRSKMLKELSQITGHYIICGAGDTGTPLMEELLKAKAKVVMIDHDLEKLEKLNEKYGVMYVVGESTDDDILQRAGIERATGLFAVLHSDKDNLFITVTAHGLNPKLRIISKAIDLKMKTKLVNSGAVGVISPNHIGGLRMASEMMRPTVVRFLDQMLRHKGDPHRIDEAEIMPGSELDGKTLNDSKIYERTGLLVVAVLYKDREDILYNPSADTLLRAGNILVVIGGVAEVERLRALGARSGTP